jgi:protein phosphatase
MPWSAKAQALLVEQYGPVAVASEMSLAAQAEVLDRGKRRGLALDSLVSKIEERRQMAAAYGEAYRRYCWPVDSLSDLRLAPFHLLATEGSVHVDKDHGWHLALIQEVCSASPSILMATSHRVVDLASDDSCQAAIDWWTELTSNGGEGMVVKPWDFVATGKRGLIQPALKCRGREYLRIIYGPEYTAPAHLDRLRQRGLSTKRSLAIREFALGVEALERFVRREPLRRVHECVFGVLAMESEPVDPRL